MYRIISDLVLTRRPIDNETTLNGEKCGHKPIVWKTMSHIENHLYNIWSFITK